MNPWFLAASGVAQVALLSWRAPWPQATGFAVGLTAILAMFAWTRLFWDDHADMVLLMAGPGGLGMLMAAGPECHFTWTSYAPMVLGMTILTAPLAWRQARCVLAARAQGQGVKAMMLDWLGMLAGMAAAHGFASAGTGRVVWLHHGMMLVGMLVGMAAIRPLTVKLLGLGRTQAEGGGTAPPRRFA